MFSLVKGHFKINKRTERVHFEKQTVLENVASCARLFSCV